MKNLRVSMKLIVSFSIVIVLAVLLAVSGLWGTKKIKDAADDMYTYNVMAIDAIGLIRENFALQRYATRELIIHDASSAEYKSVKEALEELESQMDEYIAQYSLTIINEEEDILFQQFKHDYYDSYIPYKVNFISITDRNEIDSAMELIQTTGTPIIKNVSDILHEAYLFNTTIAEDALNQNANLYLTLNRIEVSALFFALIIVVLIVIYLRKSIAEPLMRITASLDYMSSTGDLKINDHTLNYANIESTRKDEIGMASRSIICLLKHIWKIENLLAHISDGDFNVEVKLLSEHDTMGKSVSKVTSNLKYMFNSIKVAEEEAQKAANAKGAFLANMSHEIRTPLNAIMGMAQIAKIAKDNPTKMIESVDQIMSSSRHLLSILNDVLDMSKIESGKLELTWEPFSLHAAFDEIHGIVSQSCSGKNIVFTSNIYQVKDVILVGDKMRINQVLVNLLGNAVKFTNDFGKITFNIEILWEDEKEIHLRYSVSDNGIGMSKTQTAKLFMPFEQTDSSIAAKYGGTGLGLSISWNIINMMGGSITVESEQGVGSTFCFNLVFEKGLALVNEVTQTHDSIDLSGKHLLLVDDIEINRIIICELLKDTEIMIDQAENGEQAINMFEHSSIGYYDFVIMDVQMPVMDGYESTQSIRKLDRTDATRIPIIAMTASAYKEDIERCMLSGMNGHIPKPIERDVMLATLLSFVNK